MKWETLTHFYTLLSSSVSPTQTFYRKGVQAYPRKFSVALQ